MRLSSKTHSRPSLVSSPPIEFNSSKATVGGVQRAFSAFQVEDITEKTVGPIARLSASLIHDLRNPLAAICAGAELLEGMDLPCPQARRLVSNMHRASRRVEQLFRELANISHGIREPCEACNLVDVVQSAFQQITDAIESQGVIIEIVIPDCIQLCIERRRMERVFVNMMVNALESMPTGGHLYISATVVRNDVTVDIDDTGQGIPGHLRHRLFQPFLNGEKTNGIGLGLALSRQTVIDHGGDLWLGEKSGQGARFCLRLPLCHARL